MWLLTICLGVSAIENHPNADLNDLHLSDEMIELLKSGKINNWLLCERAVHGDFRGLMWEAHKSDRTTADTDIDSSAEKVIRQLEVVLNGVGSKEEQDSKNIPVAVWDRLWHVDEGRICNADRDFE